MPYRPTKDDIKHQSDRALRQWHRNMTKNGEDLGYPHSSVEQCEVGGSSVPTVITDEENRCLAFMFYIAKADPRMFKAAILEYGEEPKFYGKVREDKGWWSDNHWVNCLNPTRKDWIYYVKMKHGITKNNYYLKLSKLRSLIYDLI